MSSKSDVTVFKQNGDQKHYLHEIGTIVDVREVENETKVLVNEPKDSLAFIALSKDQQGTRQAFPMIPGVQKILPITSAGVIIAANETSLISVNGSVTEQLHHGRHILDMTLDTCSNSLLMIDKKEVFVMKLLQPSLSFSRFLPQVNHAQLLASHSGRIVILTDNQDKRLHNTDGFAVINGDGSYICGSDPAKAYNIRSIGLENTALFMVDAMNSLVWQLQLENTGNICDLKVWKRISGQVPQKVSILQQQSDVCISSKTSQDQRNSYFQTTKSIDITAKPSSFDDPCHNYCLNGDCTQTSLGIPICHCGLNFTGSRCENEPCRNYCLNEGICTILEISLGTPTCSCKPGYDGKRCESMQPEALEFEAAIDYFQGFLIMSGINILFLLVIIGLAICLMIQIRRRESPVTVTKSPRTRVFSANAGRSVSRPRKTNGVLNNGFASAEKKSDTSDHTCSALVSDDGVVLDLEDCCNMTVCDRPCIEASFRKPTSRGRKRTTSCEDNEDLLSNVDFY